MQVLDNNCYSNTAGSHSLHQMIEGIMRQRYKKGIKKHPRFCLGCFVFTGNYEDQ
jgi:hypothetical protein